MTAFLMLVILTPLSLQAPNSQAQRHFVKGVAHFEKQEVERAFREFERAIRKGSDWAEPYYFAGRCKFLAGELSEARTYFEKALSIDPVHKQSTFWLSVANDSLKLGKAPQFVREKRFSESCTEIEAFLKGGGDLEQAVQILALPYKLHSRIARVIYPLFNEFVKRRQWENALNVAAVWEHAIPPDSRIGFEAAKNNLRSQVGLVYLQRDESAKADRMHEAILRHISITSPNICFLNQEFLARYRHSLEPPSILHQDLPSYTKEAIRAKVEGPVLVDGVVGADGRITQLRILEGLGYGMDKKTLTAMQEWKFKPGQLDGQPIPCLIVVEVYFSLMQ